MTKSLGVRATFLWDGFVRGTWKAERKRKIATVHSTPSEALLRFAEPEATTFEVKIAAPAASAAVP